MGKMLGLILSLICCWFVSTSAFLIDNKGPCEGLPSSPAIQEVRLRVGLSGGFTVLCDMKTPGGPWVIFQRRATPALNFTRPWVDYQRGFGSLGGDFWLGLDALHTMCYMENCQLRVDIGTDHLPPQDFGNMTIPPRADGRYYALYGRFDVAGPEDYYKLSVGDFRAESTAGDDMTGHTDTQDGMPFSTYDSDHDALSRWSCSTKFGGGGGWWFAANCGYARLNGQWGATITKGLYWATVTGTGRSATFT